MQSPFPEDRGYIIPLKETQRLNKLSDIKTSLTFTGVEMASPALKHSMVDLAELPIMSDNEQGHYSSESHLEAALKPSDVAELQKHVMSPVVGKQQQKNGRTSIGATLGKMNACNWLIILLLYVANRHWSCSSRFFLVAH